MNVKLAAQTLSDSVNTALKFVEKCVPGYLQSPQETASSVLPSTMPSIFSMSDQNFQNQKNVICLFLTAPSLN